MALHQLSLSMCFKPGHDLWVIQDNPHSKLIQSMDWLLNFQLFNSRKKKPMQKKLELIKILEQCELSSFDFNLNQKESLLIHSSQLLPNRWVLIHKGNVDIESWTASIFESWVQLNKPTLRVFLPQHISDFAFQESWNKISPESEVSFVNEIN